MKLTVPDTFKRFADCAHVCVSNLQPPEDGDWLGFFQRDWSAIVGKGLSAQTVPAKLWFTKPGSGTGGMLTVHSVSQGAAFLLHHETAFMRDAVNKYYKQSCLLSVVRVRAR